MSFSTTDNAQAAPLGDHSVDLRMIMLAAMALVVGTGGAMGAWGLLKLIALATNIFWYERVSTDAASIALPPENWIVLNWSFVP